LEAQDVGPLVKNLMEGQMKKLRGFPIVVIKIVKVRHKKEYFPAAVVGNVHGLELPG
jgi:hypothetical protein